VILRYASRIVIRFDFCVRLGIAAAFPVERASVEALTNIRSLILRLARLLLIKRVL